MGMINMSGSMKYGPSGKRRKTNAWSRKKQAERIKDLAAWNRDGNEEYRKERVREMDKHREKYPSLTNPTEYSKPEDTSYKKEISKQYTVAIGYNKGGYQVIPKTEIKDIGK